MSKNNEYITLPLNLGIMVNKILKEKMQFQPKKNKIGILSFEYTEEELALIDKLQFDNPVQGELDGIELLPNLKSLIVRSNRNSAYTQDKNILSISDKDSIKISECINLENLEIVNQTRLSFLDVSKLKKLHALSVNRNSLLEEIEGIDQIKDLWVLQCYGNESLTQISGLSEAILSNQELSDIALDLLLFPEAAGFDKRTTKLNDEIIKKFSDMNVEWHEILNNQKNIKINNFQMMKMHEKAIKALEDYVPQHCEDRTTVIGIEQYLAENVIYDNTSLEHGHSHTSGNDRNNLPSIVSGPLYGANGAYNAFMYNTCVCEGYTRAMQYLLKLKGIRSHNVHCISGEDTLHMSTDKGDDIYKIYDLPDDGYHSIISIDDMDYLYDDPCWNAGRYQRGDKSMPWTLLTKEEISRDHTLSFYERNIDNNTLKVSRNTVKIAMDRINNYRNLRLEQKKSKFTEQEIGKATSKVRTVNKDATKDIINGNIYIENNIGEK